MDRTYALLSNRYQRDEKESNQKISRLDLDIEEIQKEIEVQEKIRSESIAEMQVLKKVIPKETTRKNSQSTLSPLLSRQNSRESNFSSVIKSRSIARMNRQQLGNNSNNNSRNQIVSIQRSNQYSMSSLNDKLKGKKGVLSPINARK